MNQDVLRQVAQVTVAYLQRNPVASSELPQLVEIIGRAFLEICRNGGDLKSPLPESRTIPAALEGNPKSKPLKWTIVPSKYSRQQIQRPGYRTVSPADTAMQLTMAQHLALVQSMISDGERVGLSHRTVRR